MFFRIIAIVSFWIFFGGLHIVLAQSGDEGAGKKMSGSVWGMLTGSGNEPIGYALVKLQHLRDTSFITGSLTDDLGKFKVEDVKPGKYKMSIDYLGYDSYIDTLSIIPPLINQDLGKISLVKAAKLLDEVVLTGEKEQVVQSLDKKIYTLENNSITAGGSTLDALKQLSLIQVDTENKISVRGEGRIFFLVNGKPSGMALQNPELFLEQLPAGSVEKIEIISNPSAAYDAEGTGGIINIVTKKNGLDGQFGNVSVGIGSGNKSNFNGLWSLRKNKFAQTINLGLRSNRLGYHGNNDRFNHRYIAVDSLYGTDSLVTQNVLDAFYLNQSSSGYNTTNSVNLSYNAEYEINARNILNFGLMLNGNRGTGHDSHDYLYLDSLANPYSLFKRHITTPVLGKGGDINIGLIHKLKNNKGDIAWSGLGSYADKDTDGEYKREYYNGSGEYLGVPDLLERSYNSALNQIASNQLDFNYQLTPIHKLGLGAKYQYRLMDNEFVGEVQDTITELYQVDATQTNRFKFSDNLFAVYGNYSMVKGKWSFQTGLRAEQIYVRTVQEIGDVRQSYNDLGLFPSVYLTYKMPSGLDLQVSYSRRINRPNVEQLNPFNAKSDPYNQFLGNPYLKAEHTDAYEFSLIKYIKSFVVNVNIYNRVAHDFHQRKREVNDQNVSTVTWANQDKSITAGIEPSVKGKLTKWWSFTANGSFFYKKLIGQVGECESFERSQNNWSIRLGNNIRIKGIHEFQVSGNYMSPFMFPQGRGNMGWGIDLGYKVDVMNGKGTVSANISDLFNTREFNLDVTGIGCGTGYSFEGTVFRKRESRILNLVFTYKFGKADTKVPKKLMKEESRGGDGEF